MPTYCSKHLWLTLKTNSNELNSHQRQKRKRINDSKHRLKLKQNTTITQWSQRDDSVTVKPQIHLIDSWFTSDMTQVIAFSLLSLTSSVYMHVVRLSLNPPNIEIYYDTAITPSPSLCLSHSVFDSSLCMSVYLSFSCSLPLTLSMSPFFSLSLSVSFCLFLSLPSSSPLTLSLSRSLCVSHSLLLTHSFTSDIYIVPLQETYSEAHISHYLCLCLSPPFSGLCFLNERADEINW